MLDTLFSYLPLWVQNISTHIDYEGQRKAERIFQVILVVHGVLGFLAGYLTQQLSVTIYTIGVGFALSCLAVLPPWPMYRKNPLNWQPNVVRELEEEKPPQQPQQSGNKNSKKTR